MTPQSLYHSRRLRLLKFLEIGAPPVIIEHNCWMMLEAITGSLWKAVGRMLWFQLRLKIRTIPLVYRLLEPKDYKEAKELNQEGRK